MIKFSKRILALVLISILLSSLVACGDNKTQNKKAKADKIELTKMSYGEIWGYPSTALFDQDQTEIADKREAAFSYDMVRNEYESYQLLITAEKNISSFELAVSDLKNGDNVLSTENMEVYVQKYVSYSDSYGAGTTPDALIPMDAADNYGENEIEAGKNGGLWVTIYAPKETAVGEYTGNFELTVDGEDGRFAMDIPVSVTVRDYTLTDNTEGGTLFSWRYNRVAVGELDGSIEMMEYYYDYFQDYRISLESLPIEALTGEEMADAVEKYYDQITSYTLLKIAGEIGRELEDFPELVTEQILAIAERCTAEKNLFDKAMIYSMDEPAFWETEARGQVIARIKKMDAILQKCVDTIKADKSKRYEGIKQMPNWEEAILDIDNIMPTTERASQWLLDNQDTPEGQELLAALNNFCPLFSTFLGEGYQAIIDMCEKYDIELWWYGAGVNVGGATCYNIGNRNLLDKRTGSWLQKKYNVGGNLYWDATAATKEDRGNEYYNIYEDPYRFDHDLAVAGDGFVAYPGAAYGVYGPIPSLRLMSIRDGLEEYDILNDIEKKLKMQASAFGSDFSVSGTMDYFYNQVYKNGLVLHQDGTNGLDFTALRSSLLDLAVGLSDGTALIINNVKMSGNDATVEYYVPNGSTVTIAGQKQTPIVGLKYQYMQNVDENSWLELTVTSAEGKTAEHKNFLSNPVYKLNGFENEASVSGVTVTTNSSAQWVSGNDKFSDGAGIGFKVKGNVTGNALVDSTFVPGVSIVTSALAGDTSLSDLSELRLEVYNPGESVNVKVRMYSGKKYVDFGTFELVAGGNTLNLDLVGKENDIKSADRIAIELHEYNRAEMKIYEFYLDNIYGTKGGE